MHVSVSQVSRLENGLQAFKTEMLGNLGKVFRVPAFRLLMSESEWAAYRKGRNRK
jgi:hypothetical protein